MSIAIGKIRAAAKNLKDHIGGDPSRARSKLSWKHKISFDALVEEMVKADMLAVLEEQKRRNRHA